MRWLIQRLGTRWARFDITEQDMVDAPIVCDLCRGMGRRADLVCSRCGGDGEARRALILNCEEVDPLPARFLTYEDLCRIAGHDPDHNPTCIYRGAQGPGGSVVSGGLTHGQVIWIGTRTIVDCDITGRA